MLTPHPIKSLSGREGILPNTQPVTQESQERNVGSYKIVSSPHSLSKQDSHGGQTVFPSHTGALLRERNLRNVCSSVQRAVSRNSAHPSHRKKLPPTPSYYAPRTPRKTTHLSPLGTSTTGASHQSSSDGIAGVGHHLSSTHHPAATAPPSSPTRRGHTTLISESLSQRKPSQPPPYHRYHVLSGSFHHDREPGHTHCRVTRHLTPHQRGEKEATAATHSPHHTEDTTASSSLRHRRKRGLFAKYNV
jgi:hypothetical protein